MRYLQRPSRLVYQQLALRQTIIRPLHVSAIRRNVDATDTTSLNTSTPSISPVRQTSVSHPPPPPSSVFPPPTTSSSPIISTEASIDQTSGHRAENSDVEKAHVSTSSSDIPSRDALNLPGLKELLDREGRNGWIYRKRRRGFIFKPFFFPGFKEAMEFIVKVGEEAERVNHHPEWTNTYDYVNIILTTHTAEDVTAKDVHMAQFCDQQIDETIMRDQRSMKHLIAPPPSAAPPPAAVGVKDSFFKIDIISNLDPFAVDEEPPEIWETKQGRRNKIKRQSDRAKIAKLKARISKLEGGDQKE